MGYALKHTKGNRGSKLRSRGRRHLRVRRRVVGTALRPRLVVTRSSRHVFVQVVDDSLGKTIASASTMEADLRGSEAPKADKARTVGALVAERAKAAGSTPSCSTAAATSTTVAWPPSRMALAKLAWRCDRPPDTGREEDLNMAVQQRNNGPAASGRRGRQFHHQQHRSWRPSGRQRPRRPSGWPRAWTGSREVGVPRARREHQPRVEGRQGRPSFLLHRPRGGG